MIYFKFLLMHLKSQLQHRLSFIFLTLGQAILSFGMYLSIMVLMADSDIILGFSREEVLISGSVVLVSFSLAECFFRGFDLFPQLLANGQYERMLLRPKNIIIQILGSTADFSRFGRCLVAMLVLIMTLQQIAITSYLLLFLMIVSGMVIFGCLFIIYGALSFFTTQSLEVMNILTDGGREFGKVPYAFYGKKAMFFLTWLIPLATFQYYPLLYLLNKDQSIINLLSPVLGLLFVIPTYGLWKLGSRHYRSTGS